MFTRCTDCQTTQPLSVDQLRVNRGMIRCSHCSAVFDALAQLSETEEIDSRPPTVETALPWVQEKKSSDKLWLIGAGIGALLLMSQIVFFYGYAMTQHAQWRPVLIGFCDLLGCRLPDYKNSSAVNLVGSFTTLPDQNFEFHAAINNEADFTQAFPKVKLTLLDFDGKPFAVRVFQPTDYLTERLQTGMMLPNSTAEFSLKIAAPHVAVGGSIYELVD
jgi:predicted Zn finger-like uncharacterized protein